MERPQSGNTIRFYRDTVTPLGQLLLAGEWGDGPGITSEIRAYECYAFMLVLRGHGSYEDANGFQCALKAGDLVLVFPHTRHTYGPPIGQTWDEMYFLFTGKPFEALRHVGLLNTERPVVHVAHHELWRTRFTHLVRAPQPRTETVSMLLVSRFAALLTEMLVLSTIGELTDDEQWTAEAKLLLESNLAEDYSSEKIAREISMDNESFRKRFQALTGISPMRYRAARRMEAACDMLRYTSLSHKQIAEDLGFSDEFYFSKRFKAVVGIAPREFRQKWCLEGLSDKLIVKHTLNKDKVF